MAQELIGYTLSILGKLLIAVSVLIVHIKISREHKIDAKISKEVRHELYLTIIGIILIVIGYILESPFKA